MKGPFDIVLSCPSRGCPNELVKEEGEYLGRKAEGLLGGKG